MNALITLLALISVVLTGLGHHKGDHHIWYLVVFLQIKMFFYALFTGFRKDNYTRDDSSEI